MSHLCDLKIWYVDLDGGGGKAEADVCVDATSVQMRRLKTISQSSSDQNTHREVMYSPSCHSKPV